MSPKDNKLDDLLKPLKSLNADEIRLQSWNQTVQFELTKSKMLVTTKPKFFAQLVAALFVGLLLGAILVRTFTPQPETSTLLAQLNDEDATFERSHVNLE